MSSVTLPKGAYVKSATLSLYRLGASLVEKVGKEAYTQEEIYGQDCNIEIVPFSKRMSLNEVSWDDFNTNVKNQEYSNYYKINSKWVDFDVTGSIQGYFDEPNSFHGFLIRNWWKFTGQGGSDKGAGNISTFVSSENTEYVDERPKITLVLGYSDYVRFDNDNLTNFAYPNYPFNIKWQSNSTGPFNIDLIKDGSLIQNIAQNVNGKSFTWDVPVSSPYGSGYQLKISSSSCSAISNDSLTIKPYAVIDRFPYEMTFNGMGKRRFDLFKWSWYQPVQDHWFQYFKYQPLNDEALWQSWKGATPSRADSDKKGFWMHPGPKEGVNGSDYLYSEGDVNAGKTAEMHTPIFDLTNLTEAKLHFYYHLFTKNGASEVGDLFVDVKVNGEEWNRGIFHKTGNNGDKWNKVTIELSKYKGKMVQFAFRAKHKNTVECDICIDDISVEGVGGQVGTISPDTIVDEKFSLVNTDNMITYNNFGPNATAKIITTLGRVLYQKNIEAGQSGAIKLSDMNLSKGFYILTVDSEKQYIRKSLLKIK